MNQKINAKAKVQVTIEIDLHQPWGGECQISQLYDQASREAKDRTIRAIGKEMPAARIIGEPKVLGILTEAT